ncbi:MAG: response regulator transcription factor FixJ [Bauldia sp.]|nr:response regulator transcription factor FixJ [Bauldia sp.]
MSDAIVHIVDDDAAMRDSLAFLLAAAGMKAEAHESAMAFLKALPGLSASCVVTDVRMPEMSGIDLLGRLHAERPGLPVIVMTGHGDIALAVQAMKLGAVDFIEKPFDDTVLIAAVESALGKTRELGLRDAERAEIIARLEQLSPRERQVLDGLVGGKPNKVIAFDLDISPRTVEVYRANVMTKMQAASLSQLVRMAIAAGIVPG